MENKQCKRSGCEKLLTGKQKTCCSLECKRIWFGESRKKENPVWTKEYEKEYSKKYREENKEHLSNINKIWRSENKEHLTNTKKNARKELKNLIISTYSNNTNCCKNCGFSDDRALQIDHINNDGAKQRKELFGSRLDAGIRFYYWLKKNKFPEGYQVLCANCNIIKLREYQKIQNGNNITLSL